MKPEKASIFRKRKVIVNRSQYKASRQPRSQALPSLPPLVVGRDWKRGKQRRENLGTRLASREHKNVWDRIKEFPGQHLECVRRHLRCNACQETPAQKKSTVEKHVKSKKHLNGISSVTKSDKKIFKIL